MPLMSVVLILHLAKPVQDPVGCVESVVDKLELRKVFSCISLYSSVQCLFIVATASDKRKWFQDNNSGVFFLTKDNESCFLGKMFCYVT